MWHGQVTNTREGFLQLAGKIRTVERSNSQDITGIFMNPTGNYHMPLKYFLEQNGFRGKIHLVDARRTAHLRKIMNLGKEKSDPEDAHVLASTPYMDKGSLDRRDHERSPLSEITREREIILRNVTRIQNHILADLCVVFPEFSSFMAVDSGTGMAILEKYTTPNSIHIMEAGKLLKFMQKSGRNHYKLEDAMELIQLSKTSIGVPDTDLAYTFRIRTNVRRLRDELAELKGVEKEIGSRSEGNEHLDNLSDMKGIGTINAATIVSEIGSISQFDSVARLQSYGGKCPDMSGSGGKSYATGITRIRNEHLSNAVHESAVSLVLHRNHEFYELFNREMGKKKSRTEAYIVVGKRLLFHVYSMMKNQKPYRERKPGNRKRGRDEVPMESKSVS